MNRGGAFIVFLLSFSASSGAFGGPSETRPEPEGLAPSGGPPIPLAVPAYHLLQGVSDGLYDLVRWHLINVILPGGLARSLKESPTADSSALFARKLSENESRCLRRLGEAAVLPNAVIGRRAAAEQLGVFTDSLRDTFIDRYQLEAFGSFSGAYAADRRNWNSGFLAMAGILGGAFLYLNGVHAEAGFGGAELGVDLPSGAALRKALNSGEASGLAGVELRFKGRPFSVSARCGLRHGGLRGDRIGLKYDVRY